MKRKKPWLAILLGSSLLTILAIDLYLLLSFEFPTKLIQEPFPSPSQIAEIEQETQQTPVTENGADEEDNPQYVEDEPDDPANDIQTGQIPGSDIYVREIPITLAPDMENHLKQFRNSARMLVQEFPNSFVITMNSSDLGSSEKTVALTFDDGPDSSSTLEVVKVLNEYGIPGTFFLIGQQMDSFTNTVKAIIAGGHTIANHSWSHMRPTDISTDILMNEADSTQEVIASHSVNTKLYRPPYGLVKRTQMPALKETGYQVVCWSIDSMDWYFKDPELIVRCVVENAHPGAIVLMHSAGGSDNRKATIEALPIIIETLQEDGYRFVSLP